MRKLLKRLACEGILAFLFFPGKNQSDDARIALSAFCHMIALEVEVEDEILSGIQRLASLADPILAVASCQLDNLWSDMFQIFLALLFTKNIEYII